jgi:uncharacterized protein
VAPHGLAPTSNAAQHLAALRWLLLSPTLVVAPQAGMVAPQEGMVAPQEGTQLAVFSEAEQCSIVQWLAALQDDCTPLTHWMQSRPEARIGRYAERLLEFYLIHGPSHRLQAAHVPLRSAVDGLMVTHGELDFLLTTALSLTTEQQPQQPAPQYLHWELAVKFFLCTATGDTATPADFIGPNGVETLAHKWHKLFANQLTRAHRHTLPAPYDSHAWQPQAYTRGWMFYRWGHSVPRCEALHPAHGQGWWVNAADLATLPEADYAFLPRLHWMAPLTDIAQLGDQAVVRERDVMAVYLHDQWTSTSRTSDALMVAQLNAKLEGQLSDRTCSEVRRFFIRPPAAA